MAESTEPESFFRKIFRDISRGFSKEKLNNEIIYIKHLSQDDQVELDDIEDEYLKAAKKRGLPSEQEMLDLLKEQGVWGDKEEDEIAADKLFIQTLPEASVIPYI